MAVFFGAEVYPVTFRARASIADPTGGTTFGDYADQFTRQANVRQVTGRQIVEGGQAEDSIDCIVRIRDGELPRTIKADWRAQLRGDDFDIVTIGEPNRAGYIEMTLRRQRGGQ